jgi:hypothetical protein
MQYYTFPLNDEPSTMCVVVIQFSKYQHTLASRWASSPLLIELKPLHLKFLLALTLLTVISSTPIGSHPRMCVKLLTSSNASKPTDLPSSLANTLGQSSKLNDLAITLRRMPTSPTTLAPVLQVAEPTPIKQLYHVIGFVNFYNKCWQHCDHIIAPLTKLTGLSNAKFRQHWTTHHKQV